MKWFYLGTLVLVFAISSVICYSSYQAGYEDGMEEAPQARIDQTEAYELGWKEGREIYNLVPVPTKWVDPPNKEMMKDLKILGVVTEDPLNKGKGIAWAFFEEDNFPHVLRHYSMAIDEMPDRREAYFYVAVWGGVPLEEESEDVEE